jgi:hypothetical protein
MMLTSTITPSKKPASFTIFFLEFSTGSAMAKYNLQIGLNMARKIEYLSLLSSSLSFNPKTLGFNVVQQLFL